MRRLTIAHPCSSKNLTRRRRPLVEFHLGIIRTHTMNIVYAATLMTLKNSTIGHRCYDPRKVILRRYHMLQN